MKRVVIDTHIVDLILDTPGALEAVRAADPSKLIIVGTHIVRDELAATKDPDRRGCLLGVYEALPKEAVATHGFVLGLSRLGEARLGDGRESGISLEEVKTKGRGALKDALLATTASGEADVLVTN